MDRNNQVAGLVIFRNTYLNMIMKADSVGKEQVFGIGRILGSICSPTTTDQSCLRELWLRASKQFLWKAKEAEHIG